MGTIQEGKAQNALLALKKFSETSTTVLRDGKERIIPDTEIVTGDIILLQEGEKVPADARVISANTLKIDEASLTGESAPVTKTEAVVPVDTLPVTEQKNMLFKGTNVLSGNGMAVVVATGLATEIGKIAQKISSIDTEIPLKTNIRYLSRFIIVAVAIINIALIALGVLSGKSLKEMFTTAVALSVSIIPEESSRRDDANSRHRRVENVKAQCVGEAVASGGSVGANKNYRSGQDRNLDSKRDVASARICGRQTV